ncbi:MAG: Endoribonuclease YbeY [Bacteroidia bacterium]|nr:Endoribonuclease YbeY [Bacteroidia bacterium]
MINFFTQDFKFTLRHKTKVRQWLHSVTKTEKAEIAELNYIFGSDDYLLALNKKHLNHNTLTDIITFDNSVHSPQSIVHSQKAYNPKLQTTDYGLPALSGDIFISFERVKENAKQYNIPFEHELHRVMVHGLLHLLGYKDKKPADKARMTGKEDFYLKRF